MISKVHFYVNHDYIEVAYTRDGEAVFVSIPTEQLLRWARDNNRLVTYKPVIEDGNHVDEDAIPISEEVYIATLDKHEVECYLRLLHDEMLKNPDKLKQNKK